MNSERPISDIKAMKIARMQKIREGYFLAKQEGRVKTYYIAAPKDLSAHNHDSMESSKSVE